MKSTVLNKPKSFSACRVSQESHFSICCWACLCPCLRTCSKPFQMALRLPSFLAVACLVTCGLRTAATSTESRCSFFHPSSMRFHSSSYTVNREEFIWGWASKSPGTSDSRVAIRVSNSSTSIVLIFHRLVGLHIVTCAFCARRS